MIAEKYLVRHFLSIHHALEGELDNVYWAPSTENPAGGLTKVRSDMALLLRLSELSHPNAGLLQPLKGVAWKKQGGRGVHENSFLQADTQVRRT